MTHDKIFVTESGLSRLREELKKLKQELVEVSKGMAEAGEVGGDEWAHNPAFEAIEQKQRALMRKITELRDKISKTEIIGDSAGGEKVKIGSTVEIEFEDGRKMRVKIGDYTESDPAKGIISYKSPLGNALLGAAAGEEREYRIDGNVKKVFVLSIKKVSQ